MKERSGKRLPTSADVDDVDLHSRISAAVARIGSLKLAADMIGVSEDSVSRWSVGPTKPPFHKVVALCRAANFRVEWMATGEGPRDIVQLERASNESSQPSDKSGDVLTERKVLAIEDGMVLLHPLQVDATSREEYAEAGINYDASMAYRRELLENIHLDPRHARIFRVLGNSMYPTIQHQDVVILDASVTTVRDEGLFTLVIGDKVRAKRLQPLAAGGIRISSDNKSEGFADEVVPLAERGNLRVVGRIRGLLRWFPDGHRED